MGKGKARVVSIEQSIVNLKVARSKAAQKFYLASTTQQSEKDILKFKLYRKLIEINSRRKRKGLQPLKNLPASKNNIKIRNKTTNVLQPQNRADGNLLNLQEIPTDSVPSHFVEDEQSRSYGYNYHFDTDEDIQLRTELFECMDKTYGMHRPKQHPSRVSHAYF